MKTNKYNQTSLTKGKSTTKIAIMTKQSKKDPNIKYKRLAVDIPEEKHKRLKVYCIENDIQITEFIEKLIDQALPKNKDK